MDLSTPVTTPAARVLIVDDEPANLDMLSRRLSVRRFNVLTASSGEIALRLIKDERPDIVLLDLMMPGMSGLETLQRIRAVHSASDLPVIIVTASNDRREMLATIGDGANDYVTKPVDLEVLLARIAVQLNMRAAFRKAVSDHALLQRRMEARARLEMLGYGDKERRVYLMNELHQGLGKGELQVFYQPQYNIRHNEVASAEALLRWHSPSLGIIPPDHFIPMAEETGDIAALTEWVVAAAIRDHARLAEQGHKIRLAINLSAALASDSAFVDRLVAILAGHVDAISLELTESAIFAEPEEAIRNIRRFSDMGVRVAIDDYGTGMSSLSYIQRLPVQELKIDKMFVSKLTTTHRDPLLVRSTIELAHALDFEVVAEGVENAETLALLKIMGCDLAQGYFFGAPMSIADFTAYLSDHTRLDDARTPFDAAGYIRGLVDEGKRETA